MIKIIVVEDLPTHQDYFKSLIDNEEGMECIDIISTGAEAIVRVPSLDADIVLIDLGLPDMDGVNCIAQLKVLCPDLIFIAVTIYQDDNHIFEAIMSGANGYVLKKSKTYQIIDSIKDLYNGGAPISSEIAIKIIQKLRKSKNLLPNPDFSITNRESEILQYLSEGLSYKEISDRIYISTKTFKSHIYSIYRKLNVHNRTEALNKYFNK